ALGFRHFPGHGLFPGERPGFNRAVPLHRELHQARRAIEDCGDSYDSKALATAPSGDEMKRQAAFRWRPAFSFVNSRPESAMMIKQSLKLRRRIQSCYTFVGSNMSQTIEAIYENGIFRPLSPVDLPEGTRVRVAPGEWPANTDDLV